MIVWGILEFQLMQLINLAMENQETEDRYFMEEDGGYLPDATEVHRCTVDFIMSCVNGRLCAKRFYKKALDMITRWEERRKAIAEQYRERIRADIASGKMEFCLYDDIFSNQKRQMPVEYADKIDGLPEGWQMIKEALAEALKK